MTIVQLTEISLQFGGHTVLDRVSLTLSPRDRLALAGHNGSGKSCLMRLAAGEIEPDGGTVTRTRGHSVAYLPQTGVAPPDLELRAAAEQAFTHAHRMQHRRRELEHRLAERGPDDTDTQTLLAEYQALSEALERSGYDRREAQIDRVLRGLGFGDEDFTRPCREFSGGWQMRIALGRILLESPDLLLLDEPTNYLDLEARDWLLQFIRAYRGGVVIVAHDRYFLDRCVDAVAELFLGRLRRYSGNYSAYREQRGRELEQQRRSWERQQEEIERLERFIARFRYNASKAPLVQSRIKQLEKMERIELPDSLKRVSIRFPAPQRSVRVVLQAAKLGKRYGGRLVFDGVSLTLERREKLALVGPNGSGKSSLLRILAGRDTDYQGTLQLGDGVTLGFFSQDDIERLDGDRTVIEELEQTAPYELQPRLRELLGAFLFSGDEIRKPLRVLSGGERTRVAILKLVLRRHNLLILDEPTNHLDIHSQEILQSALGEYGGTVVFVSHDREFLRGVATRVLEFRLDGDSRPSRTTLYLGDYAYYRWKTAADSERAFATESDTALQRSAPPESPGDRETQTESLNNRARLERKSLKAELGRIEREEAAILERVEQLERRRERLHHELADPQVYSNGERVKPLTETLARTEDQHERLLDRWQQLDVRRTEIINELE